MERKLAIITGADGGMGMEITRAVAREGYAVIMACCSLSKAEPKCRELAKETGNKNMEVWEIDLASLASVKTFANRVLQRNTSIALLMNNAGTMETGLHITEDGLERTVSVNYVGPCLLTRLLLPLMGQGTRIVNMVSCTYAIGKLDFPDFFLRGNTKLALLLFTFELAERLRVRGITVNAADPGIVSTDIIRMHQWFDPLTDIFFRPFIRTPLQGASTAIGLLLDVEAGKQTATFNLNNHLHPLSEKYTYHVQRVQLWEETERILSEKGFTVNDKR